MELKPGYKMTEVGVIPEDWKDAPLGGLAEIRMCKRIFSEQTNSSGVLVKLRRTLLSENFHTPMGSSHCWLYAAV